MLDIKYIEENVDAVKKNLKRRNTSFDDEIDKIISLNKIRKELQKKVDDYRFEKNKLTDEFSKSDSKTKETLKLKVKEINTVLENDESLLKNTKKELDYILSFLPNMIDASVPSGKDDSENPELFKWDPEHYKENNLNHWEIAEKLNLIDFKLGAKLSGSRFVVYKGLGSKLLRAIGNILLDFHEKNGFMELSVPVVVNENIMFGTGQLPKFEDDAFKTGEQYLIPTGEVPLTNIYNNEIIDKSLLPLYLTTNSLCFRKEAGSAGKDTKGIIRMHQFNKVEMVKLVEPDTSFKELENMVNNASDILKLFNLRHRVVTLCSGDIGFGSAKTYDLEVWFPGQNKYREISSCSNCLDFQARRMNTRYKDGDVINYLHTLNGSGLAIDRLFAAILENYFEDGKLKLPDVLKPYFNNREYL
ncbi:serine--tRNA ligase [Spiroplasma turonicum]|uniref:Serine--tRNA ligase n=1 Tax=Spiroplasma turonicum TaxID=216946 RepID=A0A0K1P758_9MOLU|nr:serine--tRNA ligase [Spiroplasma turonicum]AKU80156.1 seryl-tRNA synthetase [Spiroplasma turonicum]ALX71156.1 seryl-tRNA synthetase [Spiroplasma turonicum]